MKAHNWPTDRLGLEVNVRGERRRKVFHLDKRTPQILTKSEAMLRVKAYREAYGGLMRYRVVRWTRNRHYTRQYAIYGRRR